MSSISGFKCGHRIRPQPSRKAVPFRNRPIVIILAVLATCGHLFEIPLAASPVPKYTYRIVETFHHDSDAFTQGFVFHNGFFYEGTGRYGESTLRRVEPTTGKVLQSVSLADDLFGEGIAIFKDKIYQLTWRSHVGFVYDLKTFERIRTFHYPTEGWGLTHDGTDLIMSDGTAGLFFLDPETLEEKRRIRAHGPSGTINQLNELEWIQGEIFANVWQTDQIVRINPETGELTGRILLDGLLDSVKLNEPADVLNGIAYAPDSGRLFVTGKWWPAVFEIELFPKPSDDQARILTWQLQGDRFAITFYAKDGFTYWLQASSTPWKGGWKDLQARLAGNDHVTTLTVPPTSTGHNYFFRLAKRPPR